jgi:hypothetical protein
VGGRVQGRGGEQEDGIKEESSKKIGKGEGGWVVEGYIQEGIEEDSSKKNGWAEVGGMGGKGSSLLVSSRFDRESNRIWSLSSAVGFPLSARVEGRD